MLCKKKIFSEKLDINAAPKVEAFNPEYRPGGGNKQIFSEKLDINAAPKVEAFNPEYKPGNYIN